MTSPFRITAVELLAEIERAGISPVFAPDKLKFIDRPPPQFIPLLAVLHTGLRATLNNRPWFGLSSETGWATTLNPNEPIPGWIDLLAVKGDTRWDRIRPAARLELPGLFVDVPEPKPSERLPRPKKARAMA